MIKLRDLLNEASFLDKMKRINSGWDPKKALASWKDNYEKNNPEDKADHQKYMKDAEKWIKDMSSKGPTVKVGDLVKVTERSDHKEYIGKIVKEIETQGAFGFAGRLDPNRIPSWQIDCYQEKNIGTSKKPIEYKGKKYYFKGTLTYGQHEEGNKGAFSKL